MTKRILAIILSVTMMITFLPVATFAGGSPVRIAATPGAGLISTGVGEPRARQDSPWYNGGDMDGDITFSIADGDNGTSVLTLNYYNPREVREVTEVYTAIPQEGFMFDGWTYSYWDAADDEVKTQALTDGTVLAKENVVFLDGPIMANFKAEEITIADILPADFPTDDYDPWYNSENDDVCLYLDADNSKLVFDNTPFSDGVLISSVLSKAEKDPTWADTTTCRLVYSTDDIVVQFNMTGDAGDELENIVVTHCAFSGVEGTYEPLECELYAITNAAPEGDKETNHGYITIDKETAEEDETVTVTVNPAEGYQLKSLTVLSAISFAPPIFPTQDTQDTTKYTFSMPDYPVNVTAAFEVPAHTHTFTYAASDNVLTATCEDGCDDGFDENPLTLTLTAPENLAYDGNAKAFTFAAGEADAWTDAGLELPDIIYCIKQSGQSEYLPLFGTLKFAGNYMAQITVDGKTAQVEFAITKATPYIKTTPAPNEIEYGETLADSTLFGGYVQVSSTDSTQVGGLFEWTEPDTVPGVADSNVTLYSVTFTPGDEQNFATVSCQVTVTVNHTHSPVLVKGQEPTAVAGFKDYYECACGAYYEDAAGEIPIENLAAWKAEGGAGYIAPVTYAVTYYNGDPVEQGPDTYEEKADGIHVYTFDLVFTGKTDKDLIMESACNEIYLEEMTVGGNLLSNESADSVVVYMTDSTIEGDFRTTKGEEEIYPCVHVDGDNVIKGDVVSDTTFTVYGETGATLQVASVTAEDYLILQNVRLENVKEDYVFGESTTLTPEDESLPITITVKETVTFEDEETFIINNGKPFAFGEELEIGTPTVFDENGEELDPQPELDIFYYAVEEEGYSFVQVDGVPTEEGEYCVAFFVSEDDPDYCGGGSYFFSIGHNIQKVAGKPATVTEDGYKDYYYCEGCDTYYEDEAGETPIDDLETWKAEGGAGYLAVLKVIDTIVINGFSDPITGGKVSDYLNITIPEDAHFHFLGIGMRWYDDAADNFITDVEAVFKDGKMYSLGGELVADEGYIFAEHPTVLLNGGEYPVDTAHSFTYSSSPRSFKLWTASKKATAPIEPLETVVDLRIGDKEFYGVEGNQTLIVDSLDDIQDITVLTQNGLDIEGMSEDWSMSTKFLDSEGRGVLEVQVFEEGDDYVTFNLQSHYADCPGANVQDFQIMMITAKLPTVENLLGDANDDGAVNMKDVLTVRRVLADLDVETYSAVNADCNEDGDVNMKDVLMLRQFLASMIDKLGA